MIKATRTPDYTGAGQRQRHAPETREAVIAALLGGESIQSVAEEFRIPANTIRNWREAGSTPIRRRWLACTYGEFLAYLAQIHGPEYLQRPDGEPLEPRRPYLQST